MDSKNLCSCHPAPACHPRRGDSRVKNPLAPVILSEAQRSRRIFFSRFLPCKTNLPIPVAPSIARRFFVIPGLPRDLSPFLPAPVGTSIARPRLFVIPSLSRDLCRVVCFHMQGLVPAWAFTFLCCQRKVKRKESTRGCAPGPPWGSGCVSRTALPHTRSPKGVAIPGSDATGRRDNT